ncbi:5-formyltetrahydrofolate cyclo-ligase [Hymenobacter luteus]|uniref:5-formyltetrahydrofolate cyclo-ligase n=2 Tax=Hymenobacter TaxID=89966 RepID=A0A7W9W9U9_9BACT|nr:MULTISPECIES: 5-formyltetrahydrofolate cyclo-ligase [Hymenobacter]MBB4599631.1 5-formyltetrahydrofolate cyclo-ligase [Hymenobacter latericoloratus]MBB6058059.1 5-formyltetrahydrofolate cyclo-ligase [Hymenobacter luteus]
MTKAELRQQALARRRALSDEEVARRSAALWEQLQQAFPWREWRWLHLFLPIARQQEPDTWPLIRQLWAERPALQLAVPVVQPDGRTLRHFHLTSEAQLENNRWGIPEPIGAVEALPPRLDAILIPLLAFDERGHRVGYGKGFYDQFLPQCRPDALRIGVSLEPPVPRIEDAWAGDVPLHACLTPERVWWFEQR